MISRYRVQLVPQFGPATEIELGVRERSPWRAAMQLFVLEMRHGWQRPGLDGTATVESPPGQQHGAFAMRGASLAAYRRTLDGATS